jgi:hypothetical protein
MTRSELAIGLVTFAVVIAAGTLSERFVDRHFALAGADSGLASTDGAETPGAPALPGACVDDEGSWKNWPWPNVPALSPKCRQDR